MTRFSRYEALRDAGATPVEVCREAWAHEQDAIKAILVLREVFQLSLADAKALLDAEAAARRAAEPDPRVWVEMAVIDPRTRAVVHQTSYSAPRALVRKAMVRPPDVDRPDLISWGNVTRAELEELAMSDCLDCGMVEEDMAACPPEQLIWSTFHQER